MYCERKRGEIFQSAEYFPNFPNQSAVGGYDYTFVDEIPAKYHCQICSYVLRDARLTVCCGQHFCDLCLKQWSASQGSRLTCPYCREEGSSSVLNKALIREINEFRVKCTNHQKGCDWVGELGGLNKHQMMDVALKLLNVRMLGLGRY